ncbi:MAG TPA: hypothetical protein O0X70_01520 [Methanocorpusculum sp.]|nr:hypothetical protein [Methanocorpusculum sp.]
MRKIFYFLIAALVITGCVLCAGCTTNASGAISTDSPQPFPVVTQTAVVVDESYASGAMDSDAMTITVSATSASFDVDEDVVSYASGEIPPNNKLPSHDISLVFTDY